MSWSRELECESREGALKLRCEGTEQVQSMEVDFDDLTAYTIVI
jgi:hypothetical protein